MKIVFLFISVMFLLTSCCAGYGPLQDHSEFVSARLADNKCTVLFSFHRFAYRAATGLRAFPDGGIPDYITDVNLLGVYDLHTNKYRILLREKNTEWQPGSGLFSIHSVKGNRALITQGGQLLGPFKLAAKYILLDFVSGNKETIDLKSDLRKHGRDLGYIYLVDADGMLVFVTLSLDEANNNRAYRNTSMIPEIWVRTPKGDYMKAATSAHYQRTMNGEVIYWEPSTRDFIAFSIANRNIRKVQKYKIPDYQDVEEGVFLSSDRKTIESGVKVNGKWNYQALDLKPALLK